MRLTRAALAMLPPAVERPRRDLSRDRVGIVHLGIGAFHRGHQAIYVEDRLEAGEQDWAIRGASLRSPDTRDALKPQDGLYTVAIRDGSGSRLRVIGAVHEVLVAPENPERLLATMAHPAVRIVSLTVTEKGYCHDPATGTLDERHPDIAHDLASPLTPRSAPGFLVEALRRRRDAGAAPFTVLCCDNLPANGKTVSRVVRRLAELRDGALGRHVGEHVAFPSTMVDRIVPATTEEDRRAVAAALGVTDAWPVATEPFSQWVIEDQFSAGRPRLEQAGATMVADVAPYELMKLRMLNGSHSTLAYLGYLAGYETVADCMADPAFARLIERLMAEETGPTLTPPPGADLAAYGKALRARFANPALKHRTWQIAMDGSQKLPQRLLAPARERLARGEPIPLIALGVAAWMRTVTGLDEKGGAIDVRDPLAAKFAEVAAAAGRDAVKLADGLMAIGAIFGPDLPADARFRAAVTAALAGLFVKGARGMVAGV